MTPKTKIFLVTKDKGTIHKIDAVAKNGSSIQVDEILPNLGRTEQYLETSGVCAGIVDMWCAVRVVTCHSHSTQPKGR